MAILTDIPEQDVVEEEDVASAFTSTAPRGGSHEADLPGESLPQYLREIGRVPLLTAEDEVRLAQAIDAGQAASERLADSASMLDEAERQELQAVVADGRLAREQLAEANLRLVVSIARHYSNRGVPLIDLVQE